MVRSGDDDDDDDSRGVVVRDEVLAARRCCCPWCKVVSATILLQVVGVLWNDHHPIKDADDEPTAWRSMVDIVRRRNDI
jgi:hypothetical protein